MDREVEGEANKREVQINNVGKDVTHTPRGARQLAKRKQYENLHLYAWARARAEQKKDGYMHICI